MENGYLLVLVPFENFLRCIALLRIKPSELAAAPRVAEDVNSKEEEEQGRGDKKTQEETEQEDHTETLASIQ